MMVESGSAMSSKSGLDLMKATNFYTYTKILAVIFLKPSTPKSRRLPHAALRHPPFLVPMAVGDMQIPPGQVANEKYWCLLILELRQMRTEEPFGAYPYLCTSALMLVTPSTLKSKGLNLAFPYISINGRTNPPIAPSTCRGTPQDWHTFAISGTSSTTPFGYCGAEQTTRTVREDMAFLRCLSDILLSQSVGIWTTLSPTQWQPLFMPGCPVTHIITSPLPLQSRQVFMARSKLSVPQLVMLPTQFQSPWKRVADMRITSFSITRRELNMMGLSAFECRYLVKHASVTSLCYLECSQTQANVLPYVGSISAPILLSKTARIYSLDRPF